MARLMIKCPQTEKPVFTGFAMDEGSFKSSSLVNNGVGCPHCGQTHVWNKKDAWLEGQQ